jgi:hypothetical protein
MRDDQFCFYDQFFYLLSGEFSSNTFLFYLMKASSQFTLCSRHRLLNSPYRRSTDLILADLIFRIAIGVWTNLVRTSATGPWVTECIIYGLYLNVLQSYKNPRQKLWSTNHRKRFFSFHHSLQSSHPQFPKGSSPIEIYCFESLPAFRLSFFRPRIQFMYIACDQRFSWTLTCLYLFPNIFDLRTHVALHDHRNMWPQ